MDGGFPRLLSESPYAELVVNSVADSIYLLSLEGTIVDCNATACDLLGYEREELVGKYFSVLRPADDLPRAEEALAELIKTGSLRKELTHRTRDGREIPVEVHSRLIDIAGRRLILSVARDISQRVEAERKLAMSHRWFQLLFEKTGTANTFFDPEGRLVLGNELALRMLGAGSLSDVLGRSIDELMGPGLGPLLKERLLRVVRTRQPETHVSEVSTQDGMKWTRTSYYPLAGEDGILAGVQLMAIDVTDLKRQEEEIQRVNRLYALLGELGQTLVRVRGRQELFDEFCRIAVKNGGFPAVAIVWADRESGNGVPLARAGRAADYLEGITIRLDESPEGMGPLGRSLREARPALCLDFETDPLALPWKDRARRWGLRSAASIPIVVKGTAVASFTVYSDRAGAFSEAEMDLFEKAAADLAFGLERFEAQEALEGNRRRYEQVFEHSGTANALFDARGLLLLQNTLFGRINRGEPGEALGKRPEESLEGDFGAEFARWLDLVTESREGATFETEVAEGDRRRIWQCSFVPFRDGRGQLECVQAISQDVTEERRLSEKLQQAQKLDSIGVLAGGIAHDFNNLLGGIFGYLELAELELEGGNAESARERLAKASGVLSRAKALTGQLLTFSKGSQPIRKPVRLGPLIREWTEFALAGSDLSMELDIADDLWTCLCDDAQIGQVLNNLVINARQASSPGGRVKVRAFNVPPGSVGVSVTDEGQGIPASILNRIFEPFFTTKKTGSGLGLATSYSIARQHGGSIEVDSAPGRGTTMTLSLPATRESPPETERAESPRAAGRRGVAVVMDDQESIQEWLGELLSRLGFEVRRASDGEGALAAYRELREEGREISLCVLDLTVPGRLGGAETARLLRKEGSQARIIGMSGYSEDQSAESGVFDARLTKPFTLKDLSGVLAGLGLLAGAAP